MADLGRASAESRRATLGEQGFRDSMTKVAHASAGIDSNAQDELKSDLTEAVRMVTQSPGFQDKGHHDKLTTVQGQLVAKIDEQWNHLKPDRASSKTQIANVASANIFEVYLGPLPMKIALYPCTKDTKMLARALHSVIYSEKELCELLLHREGIGKGDGMLDKPGLQEFICKVLTGDPTAMANKLHKCPKCDFVKWLNPSQMPNCPACPVTKVDLNGRKGCGKGSVKSKWMLAKNQPLATAKVQRSVTSYFS
ncbi:hypothetical protein THAOC_22314 [Thalassiosira oceanica]|uniref:Uncharacterized protein n=1 Tax=Thalassiosira oceanica TaxID=159749 RepID=K0SGB9_THAOC|nr:hypothetical protein THAOC_22314 [Thalassiosira oceanica]|eukprot:EJK57622.1 hypothetical protein THAOC_22314 [Thalassiosira oceanica]